MPFVVAEEFQFLLLERVNRPCEIHHHRDLDHFVYVQLQGTHLDDTARSVDFDGAHESKVYAGNQQGQEPRGEDEAEARCLAEELEAWNDVADKNQRDSEKDDLQVVPYQVQTALARAEQPGGGREDAQDGEHDQDQHNDPDHLVSFGVLENVPECSFPACHLKAFLLLP